MSNYFSLLPKGSIQDGAPPAREIHQREVVFFADVRNVERAVLAYPLQIRFINTDLGPSDGYRSKMSFRNQNIPVAESQHHIINPTNPRGAFDDGVEDRLHVCRRAADDAENLGRGRLMLQGLSQLCIALLKFFEKSYVLDGDYGLVSKSLEQRDLLL